MVDVTGFTFEIGGKSEKVTNPEYAASYGPHDYDGIAKWFFPYRKGDGYPILMTFNGHEKKGTLAIEAPDGGPGGSGPAIAADLALSEAVTPMEHTVTPCRSPVTRRALERTVLSQARRGLRFADRTFMRRDVP